MKQDSIQDNKLKLLGKLTASLFHEIRNPLSAIKLNLDLIKMYESELNQEVLESVNDCKKAAERIQDLTDNILNYARKSNNVKENISLNELSNTALKLLTVKASKKSVNLIGNFYEKQLTVYANENKLLQVILNLANNAIDSCDKRGTVKIITEIDSEGQSVLKVQDNGCGISEEDQTKIFEDFFTKKKHGTGLGLSVCKLILDEIDAKLGLKSQLNIGTTFSITFAKNESET
ncbi:MAG: hypothetical protein Fur0015_03020 [Ignavibacteriales bacterium]